MLTVAMVGMGWHSWLFREEMKALLGPSVTKALSPWLRELPHPNYPLRPERYFSARSTPTVMDVKTEGQLFPSSFFLLDTYVPTLSNYTKLK